MITPEQIQNILHEHFPNSHIDVNDVRGDGSHYAVSVKSPDFIGKSRVEQHRLVYQTLEGHVGTTIHAFALQTSPLNA